MMSFNTTIFLVLCHLVEHFYLTVIQGELFSIRLSLIETLRDLEHWFPLTVFLHHFQKKAKSPTFPYMLSLALIPVFTGVQ